MHEGGSCTLRMSVSMLMTTRCHLTVRKVHSVDVSVDADDHQVPSHGEEGALNATG